MFKRLHKTLSTWCILSLTACQTAVSPYPEAGSGIAPLAGETSAADNPSKIPQDLLRFAFDPDLPDSRFIGYTGGPGSNAGGSYQNYRRVGEHNLTIGYANRELKIDFTHENGNGLSFRIGSYWWPVSPPGVSGSVSVAIFISPGDEILLAVGGVPAAIIYPADMRARVLGYQGNDVDKILTPNSLEVFAKIPPSTSQVEPG
jgi:hypothetical protein